MLELVLKRGGESVAFEDELHAADFEAAFDVALLAALTVLARIGGVARLENEAGHQEEVAVFGFKEEAAVVEAGGQADVVGEELAAIV
jgi:hypothetical protein